MKNKKITAPNNLFAGQQGFAIAALLPLFILIIAIITAILGPDSGNLFNQIFDQLGSPTPTFVSVSPTSSNNPTVPAGQPTTQSNPTATPTIPSHAGNILRVPQEYATIQAAVDAAAENDTVLISNGNYGGFNVNKKNYSYGGKF